MFYFAIKLTLYLYNLFKIGRVCVVHMRPNLNFEKPLRDSFIKNAKIKIKKLKITKKNQA
jgi:hypothetical protein